MPVARLSGKVLGPEDPSRAVRARLLYKLFLAGWDIYNGNGDQLVTLRNIQKKIIESDAFVFTPSPTIDDLFNLTSIFVGFQTFDGDLENKSAVIINNDNSWNEYFELVKHLHKMGTVKQSYQDFFTIVRNTKNAVSFLQKNFVATNKKPHAEPDIIEAGSIYKEGDKAVKKPEKKVCIFCSASIKKQPYLDDGYNIGFEFAKNNIGCISGAGKTGIMGEVVRGAYEGGGWSGGSNIPHIIKLEGLPDGLNEFWPRADIYTRMEVMMEHSDAFVILPGGMGTVQELLALVVLKMQSNDLVKDKKIVIYNRIDEETGLKFWDPMIDLLHKRGCKEGNVFDVVETKEEVLKAIL
jgi:uncharacterized protein (TIGR00730 family)